ncbi:MAG: outer membrane protein transport protein [Sulfurovum sp.]
MTTTNTKRLTKIITLSLITSTMLNATNGDHLIAVGAKARGMGGVSIAISHGAESGLSNPAMITSIEGTEIAFGGTIFMPTIDSAFAGATIPAQTHTSDADLNIIPEVSIAHKIDDNWYIGIGMWGTAGMGTDYSKAGVVNPFVTGQFSNMNMVTNLQLMQFGVPIAYKYEGLSIAVTPILQYGNLDINYLMPTAPNTTSNTGTGLSQDFSFGYNVGLAYDFSNGLTIGALYKSAIEMEYKNQLTTATIPFGITLPDGDILEQPAEIGVGFSYATDGHTIAFDYKVIQWSEAKGYGDFGWEDQDVYAVGYQYKEHDWALRAGYNYAQSPVVSGANPSLNLFNLLGFPATSESHYTLGGTYNITEAFSVDLAYVYSPESSEAFNVTALGMGIDTITTTHSENSLSFQLVYNF